MYFNEETKAAFETKEIYDMYVEAPKNVKLAQLKAKMKQDNQ